MLQEPQYRRVCLVEYFGLAIKNDNELRNQPDAGIRLGDKPAPGGAAALAYSSLGGRAAVGRF